METIIMNRRGIEERSNRAFADKTAVISITDVDYTFAELCHQPNKRLKIAFNDVDGDVFLDELGRDFTNEDRLNLEKKYQMLSDEQAAEIAEFYHECMQEGINTLIVQCEYGQSRSAAVVAAIREFESQDGIAIFADDRYYPNRVVFRKTLKALREHRESNCVLVG